MLTHIPMSEIDDYQRRDPRWVINHRTIDNPSIDEPVAIFHLGDVIYRGFVARITADRIYLKDHP